MNGLIATLSFNLAKINSFQSKNIEKEIEKTKDVLFQSPIEGIFSGISIISRPCKVYAVQEADVKFAFNLSLTFDGELS